MTTQPEKSAIKATSPDRMDRVVTSLFLYGPQDMATIAATTGYSEAYLRNSGMMRDEKTFIMKDMIGGDPKRASAPANTKLYWLKNDVLKTQLLARYPIKEVVGMLKDVVEPQEGKMSYLDNYGLHDWMMSSLLGAWVQSAHPPEFGVYRWLHSFHLRRWMPRLNPKSTESSLAPDTSLTVVTKTGFINAWLEIGRRDRREDFTERVQDYTLANAVLLQEKKIAYPRPLIFVVAKGVSENLIYEAVQAGVNRPQVPKLLDTHPEMVQFFWAKEAEVMADPWGDVFYDFRQFDPEREANPKFSWEHLTILKHPDNLAAPEFIGYKEGADN